MLTLCAVWLTFATSGVVFSEPAPVDALSMGLIVLLPTVGLVLFTPALMTYLAAWLVVTAAEFLSATLSHDLALSVKHTAISFYLVLASFIIAAFIAREPIRHTYLILQAWLVGAVVAATAGLIGYFSLLPGAYALFTKFDRAAGTFKDPNVFGPFLVIPMLYLVHLGLRRSWRTGLVVLPVAAFLGLACLLSFSRGAWLNMAIAVAAWAGLTLFTCTHLERVKLVGLSLVGLFVASGVLVGALQTEKVAELMSQRASLSQSYDSGPEGRFGGQMKALDLVADNPFGIGALSFRDHHHEEPHNVYLSMALNTGWLGGILYVLLCIASMAVGLKASLRAGPVQPLAIIATAALLGNVLEGLIIDTDHWRHFYIQMGLVWGLATAPAIAASLTGSQPAPLQQTVLAAAPRPRYKARSDVISSQPRRAKRLVGSR